MQKQKLIAVYCMPHSEQYALLFVNFLDLFQHDMVFFHVNITPFSSDKK